MGGDKASSRFFSKSCQIKYAVKNGCLRSRVTSAGTRQQNTISNNPAIWVEPIRVLTLCAVGRWHHFSARSPTWVLESENFIPNHPVASLLKLKFVLNISSLPLEPFTILRKLKPIKKTGKRLAGLSICAGRRQA